MTSLMVRVWESVHLSIMLLATLAESMGIRDGTPSTANSSFIISPKINESPLENWLVRKNVVLLLLLLLLLLMLFSSFL